MTALVAQLGPEVDEPVPPFAGAWLTAYDRGRNVVDWYAH